MPLDRTAAAGAFLSVLAILIFATMVFQNGFPALGYTLDTSHYLSAQGDIGLGYSQFLWENRNVDVIAQAFVMFVAALSCLAIFRETGGGEE
jgi:multisubunit Na+/H+ antiporter MnhB subunit